MISVSYELFLVDKYWTESIVLNWRTNSIDDESYKFLGEVTRSTKTVFIDLVFFLACFVLSFVWKLFINSFQTISLNTNEIENNPDNW